MTQSTIRIPFYKIQLKHRSVVMHGVQSATSPNSSLVFAHQPLSVEPYRLMQLAYWKQYVDWVYLKVFEDIHSL